MAGHPEGQLMFGDRIQSSLKRATTLAGWLTGAMMAPEAAEAMEGLVVDDKSGKPLANVTLSVVGRMQTATSDADGKFVLVPDPKPPFDLLAILPGSGYMKPVTVEEIPASGPLVVRLEPIGQEWVTVTAEAAPGIRVAPAAATTLVSDADMRSREVRNLTQALENVPGVTNVSEGQAAAPAIRGLAQARSLVLIDGARVTAERRIGPSATFLDPFVLEGVEVARGPGSVSYGSDALGGVIMARTRRPAPGAPLSFELAGTIGTGVPQARAGFQVASGIADEAGILFSAHYREFEDYDSPEGEVLNSGATDYGFLLAFTQKAPGGLVSLSVEADYGRDIERPRTNSSEVRFYYPTEDSLRMTATYESGPVIGFDATELALFIGDYAIVTDQDAFGTATTPRQTLRADVSANDFELRAIGEKHWGQAQFEFGLDFNGRFDLNADDVTIDYDLAGNQTQESTFTTIEDARRIDAGIFVTVDGAVSKVVTLAGGLRFDSVRSTNEGGYFGDITVSNSEPSGFAALTLGPWGGFSTTVQYAHGFRDARLSDRFFRGVTGAGFIIGNPDLEPETSDQFDLAFRYAVGRWRPALYLYHYDIDNLIERYEDPSQPDFFFFRNRGTARIRGVELEVQAELPWQVTLLISGTVADGQALDDGAALDDISPETATVQARKSFGDRFWLQLRTGWVGELDEPGPNEVAREDYTLVDLSAGWRITKSFELSLLVRNLLDETYLLTPDRRSPLAPGVSGMLSARFTF
jgi:outer membrane receptor protein involved in Fe transport